MPWDGEPETIAQLLEAYVVEAKITGKDPATTLYAVQSTKRNGTLSEITANQPYKLFLAPRRNRLIGLGMSQNAMMPGAAKPL